MGDGEFLTGFAIGMLVAVFSYWLGYSDAELDMQKDGAHRGYIVYCSDNVDNWAWIGECDE